MTQDTMRAEFEAFLIRADDLSRDEQELAERVLAIGVAGRRRSDTGAGCAAD